eukprot:TRINITY_DN52984_c0_g2_i1.p1 TRINITY_DN52984_c0_g2~~TRINITY_DN52984_c0_g2_i1.p1  ORF type:complete len:209 (+),score=28.64 TRINITY_DN52984_c0_g2_i1:80-706(+)
MAGDSREDFDACLCCLGCFPFTVLVILGGGNFLSLLVGMQGEGGFQFLQVFVFCELVSVATGLLGINMVFKRKQEGRVPRGCDCCCPCAFPPWSLMAQLIDVGAILFYISFALRKENEGSGLLLAFACIQFVAVLCDMTFGAVWLHALHKQDGDVCCAPWAQRWSGPPSPVSGAGPGVVVGVPVATGPAWSPDADPEGNEVAKGECIS